METVLFVVIPSLWFLSDSFDRSLLAHDLLDDPEETDDFSAIPAYLQDRLFAVAWQLKMK